MNALREQFKQKSGIDLSDTETVGKFPYYNNNKWGSISRGEGWKRFAEFLESKLTPLTPELSIEDSCVIIKKGVFGEFGKTYNKFDLDTWSDRSKSKKKRKK